MKEKYATKLDERKELHMYFMCLGIRSHLCSVYIPAPAHLVRQAAVPVLLGAAVSGPLS